MALRQRLVRPLVVDPADTSSHSHTVVFLHRFPESTTDDELRNKVLSEKLTRNHKTLREQLPTVRWVFPFCKAHARPWNNLSAEDRAAVGMTLGSLPYITQVILHEAERAGGLDRIIVGGQGETAEAAHEAMSSFPEAKASAYDNEEEMAAFMWDNFTLTSAHMGDLKLAGFIGMHAQDGQLTRDVKNFGMMSKGIPTTQKTNATIIKNTPHKFIHGGYKLQTSTWDGKRIDDFATFLVSLGVDRLTDSDRGKPSNETLTPRDRPDPAAAKGKRIDAKDELSDMQKYALELAKQKRAEDAQKQKVLQRIEANKVERKIRQERERQKRLHAGSRDRPTGSTNLLGGGPAVQSLPATYPDQPTQKMPGSFPQQTLGLPDDEAPHSDHSADENGDMSDGDLMEPPRRRKARREQGRPVGDGSTWGPQSQARGEMSQSQMAALGLTQVEDENDG
ncbi:putative phospholipase carboxylesterase [Diaporthe ampelina]|uniref:Putative phospholipase carboxylesterase n=1 Tax=Diaporthe ampelina TaxID=1214573 RepID=A0A0G2F9H3_9PEZI|nr:putative phospholipase carboxylesterase [Diaporthe ampelina]